MSFDEIIERLETYKNYYENDFNSSLQVSAINICDEYAILDYKTILTIKLNDVIKLILIKNGLSTYDFEEGFDFLEYISMGDYFNLSGFFKTLGFIKSGMPKKNKFTIFKPDVRKSIFNLITVYYKNMYNKKVDKKYGVQHKLLSEILYNVLLDDDGFKLLQDVFDAKITYDILSGYKIKLAKGSKRFTNGPIVPMDIRKFCQMERYKQLNEHLLSYFEIAKKETKGLTMKKTKGIQFKYERAIQDLIQGINKQDMSFCIDSVSKIDDEALKKQIYLFICEHNNRNFRMLEEEFENRNKDMSYIYANYFNSIGLDFNSLEEAYRNKIMEESLENIKEKIKVISKFVEKNNYFVVLINSSLEILSFIDKCIQSQIIDVDFIKDNMELIFILDTFNNFKNNIILLNGKINIRKCTDKTFLLSNYDLIKENMAILDKFGIPYSNCSEFTFLKEDILEKINLFIEVGLEDEIINNPNILNADIDLAKRVLLARSIDEDIYENGKLASYIVDKNSFFICPNKVNSLLPSIKINNESIDLSRAIETPLSYVVDDVHIPKIKIKQKSMK